MGKDSILEEINEMRFTSAGVKELLSAFYTNWDRIGKAVKKELYFGDFKELMNFLKGGDQEEQDELRDWIQDKGIQVMAFESLVNEARAYKLKASEFGQNTMSAPYAVKGENGTWRVHSTYAIDQVSGNNNTEERDVVFFEVFPYSNNIVIKIGGIHNIGRTNASTYGTNFATTVEEFKEDPSGIAKEASDFLTDDNHLKWLNKNARSEGQKIKWALKDDYSPVIEDLVNRALGLKESVINENEYLDKSNEFVKELEKSKILADNIEVVVGPSRWGKPGELRFRDHVTLRAVGIETELYVIPRGSVTQYFELYTDTGYESGRDIKVGDAKTIIKAMKRYVNKMNESVNERFNSSEFDAAHVVLGAVEEYLGDYENLETYKRFEKMSRGKDVAKKKRIIADVLMNVEDSYYGSMKLSKALYKLKSKKEELTTYVADKLGRAFESVNESIDEARVIGQPLLPRKILKHKDIPTWAEWVAQHSDGEWNWYESYPNVVNFKDGGGAWKQELSDGMQIYTGVKTSPKDWKEGPYRVRYNGDIVMESVNEAKKNKIIVWTDNKKKQTIDLDAAQLQRAVSSGHDNDFNQNIDSIKYQLDGGDKKGTTKIDRYSGGGSDTVYWELKESVNEKKQLPKEISKHKDIPSWAKYVAQQSDGEWTWYEETPTITKWKGGGAWKQDGNQTYTGVKTDGKDWDKMPTYYYVKGGKITESVNKETHKTVAIEDSILQGIAEYLETTKGKLFKVINYDKRAARDLSDLAKHLKPILDNWDEYGKVEEKLTQTFGDYLKDLGERFYDGRMAALGTYVGGRDTLENRQTALHNLNLFGNYIKSLLKEYGKDKTKLTFMKESRNVKTLESFLNEELPTHEIDPNAFQNPYKSDKSFFKKGYKDDNVMDDVVKTRPVKIQASQLKPSQDAVYLGKALGMAIGGVEGGNLEAVISQDNRILDGHHRWAATIFNNPKARVGGVQAELKIGDLVPVLRQAGDALGNKRGLPPKGGDQNIFKATLDDVKDAIYDGKYMNPQFYNKDKAIAWFEEQGEKKIQSALNLLQRVGPPGGAPPRADMPKIEPEQVQQIAKKLQGGAIDVRAPYVKEELNHLTSLESFIDEKKPGPDPYMTNLSKEDEEDKEEQMKKQAAMDDDDPNAYKDMPGDKEAREKGDMKKSKHTSAYHKKFKKVKSLEEFANDWAVIKEGYNADAVAQNVVVALDSAAQFFPRYKPAEAEAEVKDVLKKYKKLQGKNAEKAAKDIRNSLEDRGLLANDILPLDVEIIIMDNLNESNIHENLNKSDVAYQLAMDYSGNSKPKIVKLNKKEIHIKYGYKFPHEESIKSILKIHPDIELTHAGWSNTPSGGGIHKFKINESVNEGKYYPSTQIGSVTNQKDMHIFDNDPFIQKMYKQQRIQVDELDTSYSDEWQIFIDKKDKEVITFLKKNYPGHLQIDSYLAKQLAESVVNEEKDQTNDKSKIDGEGIETGLKKKADETGVPIGILRVIMRRGMAAWKSGHRPGTNSTQWGYARVNSFLTKGDGTWGKADKDMAKEVRDGGHDKKL